MDDRRPLPTAQDAKIERKGRSDYKLDRKTLHSSFRFTISVRVTGDELQAFLNKLPPEKRYGIDVWKRLSEHNTHAAAKAELERLEAISESV